MGVEGGEDFFDLAFRFGFAFALAEVFRRPVFLAFPPCLSVHIPILRLAVLILFDPVRMSAASCV